MHEVRKLFKSFNIAHHLIKKILRLKNAQKVKSQDGHLHGFSVLHPSSRFIGAVFFVLFIYSKKLWCQVAQKLAP